MLSSNFGPFLGAVSGFLGGYFASSSDSVKPIFLLLAIAYASSLVFRQIYHQSASYHRIDSSHLPNIVIATWLSRISRVYKELIREGKKFRMHNNLRYFGRGIVRILESGCLVGKNWRKKEKNKNGQGSESIEEWLLSINCSFLQHFPFPLYYFVFPRRLYPFTI